MVPPRTHDPRIRLATNVDLSALMAAPWSSGLPEKHRDRFERQVRGETAYLLAEVDGAIIGHLLLKWDGPSDEPVRSLLPPCVEIEDFVVELELRSRGIGAMLLAHAAKMTRERGLTRLGLAVGIGNTRARSLYERSGFTAADIPEFDVRWQYRAPDGSLRWEGERCIYMVKVLV
ncbi:MAG: GNAT family N-acetyltransferase [Chloroflexia bacterium]|nr:GNAT family N-acetyltransferase [Chloroflexia bacterium]